MSEIIEGSRGFLMVKWKGITEQRPALATAEYNSDSYTSKVCSYARLHTQGNVFACSDRYQSQGRAFQTLMGIAVPIYLLREQVPTWKHQPFFIKQWLLHWKGWIMMYGLWFPVCAAGTDHISLEAHDIFNLRAYFEKSLQRSGSVSQHGSFGRKAGVTFDHLHWPSNPAVLIGHLSSAPRGSLHSHLRPPSEGN